jgi:hypothetical protein
MELALFNLISRPLVNFLCNIQRKERPPPSESECETMPLHTLQQNSSCDITPRKLVSTCYE